MKKLNNNFFTFLLASIILMTTVIASSLYSSGSVVLSNGSSVQSALDTLFANNSDCPSGYKCYFIHNIPQVGDYIRMTPTLTSFKADKSKTGYNYTQTINPSKLNLWRVIKVNEDGTMEIVADEPSEEEIWFYGKNAYMNYIGYLNVLASKYENSKYTTGSRHMGYSNQIEYLTDDSKLTQTTVPWYCNTGASCHPENYENLGGGDLGYTVDTALVQKVYGKLKCKHDYFLASRIYKGSYNSLWYFSARYVAGINTRGSDNNFIYGYEGVSDTYSISHLRPILILKADINYTPGPGTLDNPFILG